MLKPEEIYNEQFELSVLGGYKREQVDSFFASVASDYEKLFKENAELIQKLKVCVEKIDEYQKDEKFLKAAIINAEKLNETSLRDLEKREKEIETAAKEKAESIVEKAQLEAENIVKTARLEASESVRTCEEQTALRIAELKLAQDAEESSLNNLKKEVSDFKDMILKLYKQHLNSLSKLPEYETKSTDSKSENSTTSAEVKSEPVAATPKQEKRVVVDKEVEETTEIHSKEADNASDEMEESVHDGSLLENEKTAEFVIEKNVQPVKPKEDVFERNFKFKDLKFGTDFDIKKEN